MLEEAGQISVADLENGAHLPPGCGTRGNSNNSSRSSSSAAVAAAIMGQLTPPASENGQASPKSVDFDRPDSDVLRFCQQLPPTVAACSSEEGTDSDIGDEQQLRRSVASPRKTSNGSQRSSVKMGNGEHKPSVADESSHSDHRQVAVKPASTSNGINHSSGPNLSRKGGMSFNNSDSINNYREDMSQSGKVEVISLLDCSSDSSSSPCNSPTPCILEHTNLPDDASTSQLENLDVSKLAEEVKLADLFTSFVHIFQYSNIHKCKQNLSRFSYYYS